MFVSKLPSNKNKWRPRVFSENTRVQLSAVSQTPPQLLESDNYHGDQSVTSVPRHGESGSSDQCLPNNVPVTADTKAAEFTILVIFHYVIPLHLTGMTVNERGIGIVTGAGFSGVTGASQDILRHFSRDLGNSWGNGGIRDYVIFALTVRIRWASRKTFYNAMWSSDMKKNICYSNFPYLVS